MEKISKDTPQNQIIDLAEKHADDNAHREHNNWHAYKRGFLDAVNLFLTDTKDNYDKL